MFKWFKKKKKKKPEPKDIDIDFLIKNFDTLEERLEYTFSDIDFDKIKKYMPKRPRRHFNSPKEDLEMAEKLEKFLKDK